MTGKVFIVGGGRSGTSFIVRLLTRLGIDTGFSTSDEHYNESARAGCESEIGINIEQSAEQIRETFELYPEVIKSPEWSFYLPFLASTCSDVIRHIVIPVRDSLDAAMSREATGLWWHAGDTHGQSRIHQAAVGAAVEAAVLSDTPVTLMHFPRHVEDWLYCYEKLSEAFPKLDKSEFRTTHESLTMEHIASRTAT